MILYSTHTYYDAVLTLTLFTGILRECMSDQCLNGGIGLNVCRLLLLHRRALGYPSPRGEFIWLALPLGRQA